METFEIFMETPLTPELPPAMTPSEQTPAKPSEQAPVSPEPEIVTTPPQETIAQSKVSVPFWKRHAWVFGVLIVLLLVVVWFAIR